MQSKFMKEQDWKKARLGKISADNRILQKGFSELGTLFNAFWFDFLSAMNWQCVDAKITNEEN